MLQADIPDERALRDNCRLRSTRDTQHTASQTSATVLDARQKDVPEYIPENGGNWCYQVLFQGICYMFSFEGYMSA